MTEDINHLKIEMATMKEEIKNTAQAVRDLVKDNKEQHQEIKKCIDDFIEAAHKEFAPKWVGDFIKAFIVICVLAVLYMIFNHVQLPTP